MITILIRGLDMGCCSSPGNEPMIRQVFKQLFVAAVLFGAGSLTGLAWKHPVLNPEPAPCRDLVRRYGEIRSCPAGTHLEVAGNEHVAFVICKCPDGTRVGPPAVTPPDSEEPLGNVPAPEHEGTRL